MKSLVHRHVLVRKQRSEAGLQLIPPALNTEKLTNLHLSTNPFASNAICLLGNNRACWRQSTQRQLLDRLTCECDCTTLATARTAASLATSEHFHALRAAGWRSEGAT